MCQPVNCQLAKKIIDNGVCFNVPGETRGFAFKYGTEYEYDLAGRVAITVDPEGGTVKYEYNQYGELIK